MYKHLVATVSPFTQMSAFPVIGRAGGSPERGVAVVGRARCSPELGACPSHPGVAVTVKVLWPAASALGCWHADCLLWAWPSDNPRD